MDTPSEMLEGVRSHGYFHSEAQPRDGKRFTLHLFREPGIPGRGVKLAPNVAVPEGTRLLKFVIDRTCASKKEYDAYCATQSGSTWAIQSGCATRRRYHIYKPENSPAHFVNTRDGPCNLRMVNFRKDAKVVYLEARCDIAAGLTLSLAYNSKEINQVIKSEQKEAKQAADRKERANSLRSRDQLVKAVAVKLANKHRRQEISALGHAAKSRKRKQAQALLDARG